VRVGDDIAVGGNDEAGTDALLRPVSRAAVELEVLVVARDVVLDRLLRGDVDHGGLDIGYDFHDRLVGDIDPAGRSRDFALRCRQARGLRNGRLGLGGWCLGETVYL